VSLAGVSEPSSRNSSSNRALWLWLIPLIFLAVFFFYPLAAVFRMAGSISLVKAGQASAWEQVAQPLAFTLWQAVLSTGLTLLLGLPAAFIFARFSFPLKNLLRVLVTLPFILPTVVVAVGFNALLGPHGLVNSTLMSAFNLQEAPLKVMNTLAAILLAHVFYNTSVVIRVVGSSWAQLDPRLEQAGRVLGASPWRVLSEVTLPLLLPAILAATLLVFLFDFTSFGVILLLGGPHFATLEVAIYTQALEMLNLPLAGLLSAVQLGCTLLMVVIYTRLSGKQAVPLMPRLQGEGTRKTGGRLETMLVFGMVAVLFILLISPLVALVLRSVTILAVGQGAAHGPAISLDYYRELFVNRRQSFFYVPPIQAVKNSLQYALLTVVISLSMGLLVIYALRPQRRLNRWPDAFIMLPLGTSAVTLGLGYLLVFNRPPLDVRTFPWLIPIAHSLVALPFVVRALQPTLSSIPQSLRQAAAVLGASSLRVWYEVDLPILTCAALVSAIFAFTISLGEFGATSFLARPENPTLPVAIYRYLSQPGELNYGQALAMSTILMLVCSLCIFLIEKISREG
jgi:thiamine transport system permease protein